MSSHRKLICRTALLAGTGGAALVLAAYGSEGGHGMGKAGESSSSPSSSASADAHNAAGPVLIDDAARIRSHCWGWLFDRAVGRRWATSAGQ